MDKTAGLDSFVKSGFFRIAAMAIATFLILIVNREFGVADNGDFSRYMANLSSKPLDLTENWPQQGSKDWNYRFFRQPLFYWSPPVDGFGKPSISSASLFWEIGKKFNDFFYSENVFNLKYAGLPFFLFHALAIFYILHFIVPSGLSGATVFIGALLVFVDPRITAFYNSLYGESVPILAVFLLTSFFFERIFSNMDKPASPAVRRIFGALVLAMLAISTLAKVQYLYFLAPALFLAYFILESEFNIEKYKKNILLLVFVSVLFGAVGFLTTSRLDNPNEVNGSRVQSYHALYYGVLPQSKNPTKIMEKLGLPADSQALIGRNAWNAASSKLISEEKNLNLKTFLMAIYIDPLAFMGSVLSNAEEVGNFEVFLGMVHGSARTYPPLFLSGATVGMTKISGVILFGVACFLAFVSFIFPFGVPPQRRFPSRVFSAILLVILVSDVFISTFDGRPDARKHLLIASITCLMIMIHSIACLIGLLRKRPMDRI